MDWEFRSGANAFPNTYDVSDPTAPIVAPSDNFYDPAAYPFRRVRFRTDLEREDVLTAEASLRRDTTLGPGRAFWKLGGKVVNRDKTQDRQNTNYAGAASRSPTTASAVRDRPTSSRDTRGSVQR